MNSSSKSDSSGVLSREHCNRPAPASVAAARHPDDAEQLQIRIHGPAWRPTLVYLPGLHGDWTLVGSFRAAVAGRVRFVEFTYPRTLVWSLEDYAQAVEAALLANGIDRGWVLGESFGSQVAWHLCRAPGRFHAEGLILANGFARHPCTWGVRLAQQLCGGVSPTWLTRFLFVYERYARFRHRRAPETLASLGEFLARRTELDRQAVKHRLSLIAEGDVRALAREIHLPVYYLAGLFDPIVPWPVVRCWLRSNCPGYRGGKTVWLADHNVLGTAPRTAAELVLHWMSRGPVEIRSP